MEAVGKARACCKPKKNVLLVEASFPNPEASTASQRVLLLFGDLFLSRNIIGDNVFDSNFHGGKKNYLLSDILVSSSLRSLWEKNTVVPVLFTCFCREQNPGLLVFLSVLPSQACDRGLWLHCNVWAVSGEFFPPTQLGTSYPWKRPSYVCSIAWISGALMASAS